MKIRKGAYFTDIHWGRRNSCAIHNQDCLDFINWFCDQVKKDPSITYIAFLGDWFENRAQINILTLSVSYNALKILNSLNLPIYFIIGNHDLHRRTTREVFSTEVFGEFNNITLVNEPTVIEDEILFCPFLFRDEYPSLSKYTNIPIWAGHFEFKNFLITGYNTVMEHGPDHKLFKDQKRIFAGHFHKRQSKDNVTYIGNSFPMDFGDAGDLSRGMMTYDHQTDDIQFVDWKDCPSYQKITLTKVLNDDWIIQPNSKMRVICTNDIELSYSDAQAVKEALKYQYSFREFRLEEDSKEKKEILTADDVEANSSFTPDEFIVESLKSLTELKNIDCNKLIEIYKGI